MSNATPLGFFERYLSLWVLLCIIAGTLLGLYLPQAAQAVGALQIAQVNLPVGLLIWVMIIPMLMKIDFSSLHEVWREKAGMGVTLVVNWAIKPFTMAFFAWLFVRHLFADWLPAEQIDSYVAGMILLGAAPCTAMVFVWSTLTKGDPAYTVVQVATNDLIILLAFVPIVRFLLGVGDVHVPMDTLILSVVLFVLIPLSFGALTRAWGIRRWGREGFEQRFLPRFDGVTSAGLLLMLVLLFTLQGETILSHPQDILLIAVPLSIQTLLIFAIAFAAAWWLKLPFDVAAPAGMIGASNFFELSVAVAIALFGAGSPAALATTVGVLTEVPLMLFLVRLANNMQHRFPRLAR